MTDRPRCGYSHTGTGEPCRMLVGSPGERCAHHRPKQLERREAIKERFLEEHGRRQGKLKEAAYAAGSSPRTIERLREEDPEFDEAVRTVCRSVDDARAKAVEDNLYRRVSTGKAAAAETIFFLINRAPHRWADVKKVQHVPEPEILELLRKQVEALRRGPRGRPFEAEYELEEA